MKKLIVLVGVLALAGCCLGKVTKAPVIWFGGGSAPLMSARGIEVVADGEFAGLQHAPILTGFEDNPEAMAAGNTISGTLLGDSLTLTVNPPATDGTVVVDGPITGSGGTDGDVTITETPSATFDFVQRVVFLRPVLNEQWYCHSTITGGTIREDGGYDAEGYLVQYVYAPDRLGGPGTDLNYIHFKVKARLDWFGVLEDAYTGQVVDFGEPTEDKWESISALAVTYVTAPSDGYLSYKDADGWHTLDYLSGSQELWDSIP